MNHRVLALLLGLTLVAGAAPPVPPLFAGRPLKAWLADLDDADLLVREEALEILTQAGPRATAAMPKVRGYLAHDSRPLRTRAALALWRIAGDARPAVAALSESLAEAGGARTEALAALAELGTAAAPAAPLLVPLLGEDDDRDGARRALARVGAAALPPLLKALESKDVRLRRNAADLLVGPMSAWLRDEHLGRVGGLASHPAGRWAPLAAGWGPVAAPCPRLANSPLSAGPHRPG